MDSNSKNFWDFKPYWCQPWSIITFGILVMVLIWTLFNNLIISSIIAFLIFIWWVLFLIIAPNAYKVGSDEKES